MYSIWIKTPAGGINTKQIASSSAYPEGGFDQINMKQMFDY